MTRPRNGATTKQEFLTSADSPTRGAQPSEVAPSSKRALDAGLHVVATPIGNAADITLRALETLRLVDAVACEDTRVSVKLFKIHNIATPLLPYHDHNAERMRPVLLARLEQGERIALISDAGTPLVSDPGYKLVREAIARGIPVQAVPGASAVLTALLVSGLPSDRFFFAGFLPPRRAARRTTLASMSSVPGTILFFEGPSRLAESLADMAEILGDRPAAVARELTKLFEETVRGRLAELAERYASIAPPKGEIVVIVGPPEVEAVEEPELDATLSQALERSSMRDAVAEVALQLGLPRKIVYARALALSESQE